MISLNGNSKKSYLIIYFLFLLLYQKAFSQRINYYPFKDGNYWGFCDAKKNLIYPCVFEEVKFLNDSFNKKPYFQISKVGKLGLFNSEKGEVLLYPTFDDIRCYNKIIITLNNQLVRIYNYEGILLQDLGYISSSYIEKSFSNKVIQMNQNFSYFTLNDSFFHKIYVENFEFLDFKNRNFAKTTQKKGIYVLKRQNEGFVYIDSIPYKYIKYYYDKKLFMAVDLNDKIFIFDKNGDRDEKFHSKLKSTKFYYQQKENRRSTSSFIYDNKKEVYSYIKDKISYTADTNIIANKILVYEFMLSEYLEVNGRYDYNGWKKDKNGFWVYLEHSDTLIKTNFNSISYLSNLVLLKKDSGEFGNIYSRDKLLIENCNLKNFEKDFEKDLNSSENYFNQISKKYFLDDYGRNYFYWFRDSIYSKYYLKSLVENQKIKPKVIDSFFFIKQTINHNTVLLNYWQDTILKLSKSCGNIVATSFCYNNKFMYKIYDSLKNSTFFFNCATKEIKQIYGFSNIEMLFDGLFYIQYVSKNNTYYNTTFNVLNSNLTKIHSFKEKLYNNSTIMNREYVLYRYKSYLSRTFTIEDQSTFMALIPNGKILKLKINTKRKKKNFRNYDEFNYIIVKHFKKNYIAIRDTFCLLKFKKIIDYYGVISSNNYFIGLRTKDSIYFLDKTLKPFIRFSNIYSYDITESYFDDLFYIEIYSKEDPDSDIEYYFKSDGTVFFEKDDE